MVLVESVVYLTFAEGRLSTVAVGWADLQESPKLVLDEVQMIPLDVVLVLERRLLLTEVGVIVLMRQELLLELLFLELLLLELLLELLLKLLLLELCVLLTIL